MSYKHLFAVYLSHAACIQISLMLCEVSGYLNKKLQILLYMLSMIKIFY